MNQDDATLIEYASRIDSREVYEDHEDFSADEPQPQIKGVTVVKQANYTQNNLLTYDVSVEYLGCELEDEFQIMEISAVRACEVAERQACYRMFGALDNLGDFFAFRVTAR